MSSEKYLKLIDRLIAKTDTNEIEWRDTAEPDTFQVSFPRYSITLTQKKDPHDLLEYVIAVGIVDSEGRKVDTFTQHELGGNYAGQLAELYQKARRRALSVDKAIDEILNALKDER